MRGSAVRRGRRSLLPFFWLRMGRGGRGREDATPSPFRALTIRAGALAVRTIASFDAFAVFFVRTRSPRFRPVCEELSSARESKMNSIVAMLRPVMHYKAVDTVLV